MRIFWYFMFGGALLPFVAIAQKSGLTVTRCIQAVDRAKPIVNIALDAENNKWVANGDGFTQVQGCDLAVAALIKPGEQSVLQYTSGNVDQRWSEEALQNVLKSRPTITAAYYDAERDFLWLGTDDNGLYQLATKPQLRLVEHHNSFKGSGKSILNIFKDKTGKYWIGTEQGLYFGPPGRWRLKLNELQVQRVRESGSDLYVLADAEIWKTRNGDSWEEVSLPEKAYEGSVYDFDIDFDNNLWIASAIVARFNPSTEEVVAFGGAEDYTSEYANRIAVDANNAVWVGTRDKGLYVIQKSDAFAVQATVVKQVSCNGNGKDAEIRVRTSGAKGKLSYQWSFAGLGGDNPVNMAPGTYTVTVTDEAGRSKTAKVTVPDPKLTVMLRQKQQETAPGAANAIVEAAITGGTPPYVFKWDNGENTNPARRLGEGAHTVTVSDQTGCNTVSTIAVTQQVSTLVVKIAESAPIACHGGTTSLRTIVSGGKGKYTYVWNASDLIGQNPTKVSAGTYTVTVSDEVGGVISYTIQVKEPEALVVSTAVLTPSSPTRPDGKASATTKGGQEPYTFKWDNGETTAQTTRLTAGIHTVIVRDANGCTANATVEMTEGNAPLAVTLKEVAPIKCQGNKTTVQAVIAGGKAPFTKEWSDPNLKGEQPDNVLAGSYQLTITDAAGNRATATVTIKEPTQLALTVKPIAPATTNKADGKANVAAKGGIEPYTYKWDNGETSNNAVRLAPGARNVTVTDANGCTAVAGVNLTEDVLPMEATIVEKIPMKCVGDKSTLTVEVTGGKSPFKYAWNEAKLGTEGTVVGVVRGTYEVTVTDVLGTTAVAKGSVNEPASLMAVPELVTAASLGKADGQVTVRPKGGKSPYQYAWSSGSREVTVGKLAVGTYVVTVTDANGCTAQGNVNVPENIPPLTAKVDMVKAIVCAGGNGTYKVSVQGGKPPYRYLWMGLDGREATFNEVVAGTHKVQVTDEAGQQFFAPFTAEEPAAMELSVVSRTPATAAGNDGRASVAVKNGKAPYTYKWSNGESTAEAKQLGTGDNIVTVTDANGCTKTTNVLISENILPLRVRIAPTSPIPCSGQTTALQATVEGGKAPFQYAWSNAALSGATPSKVAAGTYQVTVTDQKGSTQTASVTLTAPDPIKLTLTRNVGTYNDRTRDGRAAVAVKGGTGKVDIAWDNGETGPTAVRLPTGSHTVTATDASGCKAELTFEVKKRILPGLDRNTLTNGQTIPLDGLTFKADSARLEPESLPVLDELYGFLLENESIVVEIGGHTNNVPPDDYCDRLSTARAKSTMDYLVSKGIDPKRVTHVGYGKRKPIAPNTTPEGRRRNQRVEVKIVSITR